MTLTKRIPTLDGWRGIAILIVVVDHLTITHHGSLAEKIHWIGPHGVTLFFVLSGFCQPTTFKEAER
ncbi:acyltransferase family protein [Edaphobacter bradus]|uniref:acyltransferase family protein n=1 Tax=Edaphobacter bradus TaxID=2259016 RepID=UPI0021E0306A|nr:hypothetical protein [Edaphobacter bradus]